MDDNDLIVVGGSESFVFVLEVLFSGYFWIDIEEKELVRGSIYSIFFVLVFEERGLLGGEDYFRFDFGVIIVREGRGFEN